MVLCRRLVMSRDDYMHMPLTCIVLPYVGIGGAVSCLESMYLGVACDDNANDDGDELSKASLIYEKSAGCFIFSNLSLYGVTGSLVRTLTARYFFGALKCNVQT